MASQKVIAEAMMATKAFFPYEWKDTDIKQTATAWAMTFKDVPDAEFSEAYFRLLKNAKYPPKPGDLTEELKRKVVSDINTAGEWETIVSLCETLNDYLSYFAYTWIPPGAQLSQGAQAREDAEKAYNEAPRFVHDFFGGYHSALQYAYELQNLDSTGLSIRRRDYEQRRKEAIADSTVDELKDSLLTDGLTKRVIGYDQHYMPIYEGDV